MTLRARILALVTIALTPALLIQGYNEYALRSARENTVRVDTLREARASTNDLEQVGGGMRKVLDLISQEESIVSKNADACSGYLAATKSKLPGVLLLGLTELDGTLVCNSLGSQPGAFTNADRLFHKRAVETEDFAVGSYVDGLASGRPSVHFARPTRTAFGRLSGVVFLSVDLAWLSDTLGRAGLSADTALSVIDGAGTILVRVPDHDAWVGRQIAAERLAIINENIDRSRDATAWDGRRRIVAITKPRGALSSLTVSLGRDRATVFADIDAATFRGFVLIAAGGGLAFACALAGSRIFVSRPVNRLLNAAQSWRTGALDARTRLSGRSEFGRLGEAFDAMATALQRQDGDLRSEVERTRTLQERQKVMLHELNHRVKNTLATVQSLARQSRGGEGQGVNLERRILALSKTHDLLTRDDWSGASLREVLENELGPYRNGADHIRLEGPDLDLPPRYVLALGMTFHELATNAAKYGALSSERGRIEVAWTASRLETGTSRLQVSWRESGGPTVSPPTRRGFGTRLISGGITRELAGEVTLDFAASGLRCEISVPVG